MQISWSKVKSKLELSLAQLSPSLSLLYRLYTRHRLRSDHILSVRGRVHFEFHQKKSSDFRQKILWSPCCFCAKSSLRDTVHLLTLCPVCVLVQRICCARGYSHTHKDFPRFCLTQNENVLGLKVVTTPTQPQHNLNLTQLSWVWQDYDLAHQPPHHHHHHT